MKFLFHQILRDADGGGGGGADDPTKKIEALTAQIAAITKASENYKKDMLKYKDQVEELGKEKARIASEAAAAAEKKATDDGNFKSLYETAKADADRLKGELASFRDGFIKAKKLEAVKTAALKRGFVPDQVDLLEVLPMEQVVPQFVIEKGTAKVNVIGVDEFISSLEQTRPILFKKQEGAGIDDQTPPANNHPQLKSGEYTPDQLEKLKKDDPEKFNKVYGDMLRTAK